MRQETEILKFWRGSQPAGFQVLKFSHLLPPPDPNILSTRRLDAWVLPRSPYGLLECRRGRHNALC